LKNVISTYSSFHGKKMTQICQIFYIKFQQVAKNMVIFLLSYLLCSQTWLNHIMDDQPLQLHHKNRKIKRNYEKKIFFFFLKTLGSQGTRYFSN